MKVISWKYLVYNKKSPFYTMALNLSWSCILKFLSRKIWYLSTDYFHENSDRKCRQLCFLRRYSQKIIFELFWFDSEIVKKILISWNHPIIKCNSIESHWPSMWSNKQSKYISTTKPIVPFYEPSCYQHNKSHQLDFQLFL